MRPASLCQPLQACGRVRRAEDVRVFAVRGFKWPSFTFAPEAGTPNVRGASPDRSASREIGASTIADVDTTAATGSGPKAGNRVLRLRTWKTACQDRTGHAIRRRRRSRHGRKSPVEKGIFPPADPPSARQENPNGFLFP